MKFREYKTSKENLVLLGKNDETNEELIKQISSDEFVLHTSKPGSPFANIKFPSEKLSKEEIYEAGIFCAKHSQGWRDNKKDVKVHIFLGKDIYKTKSMKTGTFGIKDFKEIIIKKEDILEFEKAKPK